MNLEDALRGLLKLAQGDHSVRDALLATKDAVNPVKEFCALSSSYGFPIAEMDLVMAGEEYYAAMRRSTNGGGENSPLLEIEDDYYAMAISELEGMS